MRATPRTPRKGRQRIQSTSSSVALRGSIPTRLPTPGSASLARGYSLCALPGRGPALKDDPMNILISFRSRIAGTAEPIPVAPPEAVANPYGVTLTGTARACVTISAAVRAKHSERSLPGLRIQPGLGELHGACCSLILNHNLGRMGDPVTCLSHGSALCRSPGVLEEGPTCTSPGCPAGTLDIAYTVQRRCGTVS